MTMTMQRQCFLLTGCLLIITCETLLIPEAHRQRATRSPSPACFAEPNKRLLTLPIHDVHNGNTQRRTTLSIPFVVDANKRSFTLCARGDDDDDLDDRERVRVPRGGRQRRYEDEYEVEEQEERRYYDDDDDYYDGEDEEYEEDEFDIDFEFDRVEVDEEYASDILIPNPILDNVDPEGAGERFGEIAKDPKFWFDLLVVIAVFNFCEYVAQVPYY